jgi:hypothetical protein
MIDPRTNQELFNSETRKNMKNLMVHIRNGCLSDVPGVPLYRQKGFNIDGFPILKYMCFNVHVLSFFDFLFSRCARGTSKNEGYHFHIRDLFQRHVTSPALIHANLLLFNHRCNWNAAIENASVPFPKEAAFFPELIEKTHALSLEVSGIWHLIA